MYLRLIKPENLTLSPNPLSFTRILIHGRLTIALQHYFIAIKKKIN